ncbi:hypothetical protein ACWKSR_12760, partial [Campylobacter fetus subsp. venerealis]
TALTFLMVKVGLQAPDADRMGFIFQTYFWSWLAFTVIFTFLKNNSLTNKYTLLTGGVIGLLIPVANGLVTGNWPWVSLVNG